MKQNELKNQSDYNVMLLNAISVLKNVPSCSGSEGRAYFLNDDFVVKEYLSSDDWDYFDSIFSSYCRELKTFSDMGLSVPKIYAWIKMPNIEHYTKGQKNKNKYYILEERVKGREVYLGYIEDAYMVVKDVCSRDDFKKVVKALDGFGGFDLKSSLVDEVLKHYFEDYVLMNEMLESMNEGELSKFLLDSHRMYTEGKFSYPDLFPLNIFAFNGKLTMIDAHVNTNKEKLITLDESDFVKDMVNLFLYNYFVNNPESSTIRAKLSLNDELRKLSKKNNVLCREVMNRVLKILNKNGMAKKLNGGDKILTLVSLRSIFSEEADADKVFENFN